MLKRRWIEFCRTYWFEIGCFVVLLLLLAKNPISLRTLIPNLEPFPDTFHYIVSAKSFIHGYGFMIEREGRSFPPSVPVFYSIVLSPIFIFQNDPRMFYVVNVFLACLSLFLMCAISRKIFQHKLTQIFVLMLYTTNYYTTWYPQWAMAENLSMIVILLVVYLLLLKPSKSIAFLMAICGIALYGIKFALGPLTLAIYFVCFFRCLFFWIEQGKKKITLQDPLTVFVMSAITSLFAYSVFEYIVSGRNFFQTAWGVFSLLFLEMHKLSQIKMQNSSPAASASFFSLQNFIPNMQKHWSALQGGQTHILWELTPILPQWIASLSLAGMFISWMHKKYRWISLALLFCLFIEMMFMSTFYAFDMRYVLFAIPFLLIGFGMGLDTMYDVLKKNKKEILYWYAFVLILMIGYGISNVVRLKTVISINFRYAETPWWHIAVKSTIDYVNEHEGEFAKRPIVISAIPPYFFDFYSKHNFTLLPLSVNQEFRSQKKEAWGDYDYSNLLILYESFIRDGAPVFLMNYGLGNEQYLIQDYQKILQSFDVKEVKPGCYSLCTISQLSLKKGAK